MLPITDDDKRSTIGFLATDAGKTLLVATEKLPADRLTRISRLRRTVSPTVANAAVELLELRHRARRKFARADEMFFTPEGLEQSTGEAIAAYRATRFPAGQPIFDACCGIGGDAIALSERGRVFAVDSNTETAACARANANLPYAAANPPDNPTLHPLDIVCADVLSLDLKRLTQSGIRSAFFDPSRRGDSREGRRRLRAAEDYSPPLSWLEKLKDYFPTVGVKVSPAIDDETLLRTGGLVEFISDQGECKEAAVWFGAPADHYQELKASSPGSSGDSEYIATVLNKGSSPQTLVPFDADAPMLSEPQAWFYEPDPAVIRAHLIPQFASLVGASQIDSRIAYLTSDTYCETPFGTAYETLDWMPFNLKAIQKWLRANQRRVTVVKRRGVPLEPDEIRSRLASDSIANCPPVTLILTHRADRPIAIFCEPPAVGDQTTKQMTDASSSPL